MAFPATILDLRAELLLNGTWTDVSTYVFNRAPVIITRGHPDESTVTVVSSASLTLDNRDSRFSPRNATGTYYGSIGRNTQLRLSLPEGASYLRLAADQVSYASCPDSAGVSITGDTQIEIDATIDNWHAAQILACKWATTGNQRSWVLLLNEDATLTFKWSSGGGGVSKTATSTLAVPLPGLRRQAIKVTMAVATGQTKFYYASNISSSYTQLGSTVTPGAAAVFDSTASVQVGYCTDGGTATTGYTGIYGKVHAFKLTSGIAGTLKAGPDFTTQTAGASSFADSNSNTWTVHGTAEISNRKYRGYFEVPAWPPSQDQTGRDVATPIQGAGILRRLQAGTAPPLDSALKRGLSLASGSTAPLAYWPCEDGTDATTIASGLPGGKPMRFSGSPTFGSYSGFKASAAIPLINSSTWRGGIPGHSADTANVLRWLMHIPAGGASDLAPIIRLHTSGGVRYVDILDDIPGGGLDMEPFDSSGSEIVAAFTGGLAADGQKLLMSLELTTSGGNVALALRAMDTSGNITSITSTAAGATLGQGTSVIVDPVSAGAATPVTDTAIGHIWYQGTLDSLSGYLSLLQAWAGETAGARFSRLCTEQGVPFRSAGQLSNTVPMGRQTPLSFMALLQECADADMGQMFEPRQQLALGYRTRASLQSQAAAVTLSYTSAQLSVLQPTDDDQTTVNDVTVTRSYGGSASSRQVLTSGPLSTATPPSGVGTYPAAPALNLAYDSQLDDAAGWLLHLGTVDEPRYPGLGIDLSRTQLASLFYDCQELDIGDRLAVTSLPQWLPADGLTQLVQGMTETLAGYTAGNSPFTIAWTGVPESPYQTGVVADAVYAYVDTDGATLDANATSGATTITVDTTSWSAGRPLWTTNGANMPFDIWIGGERLTVTAASGTSNPQTLTVTRAVNGVAKAHTLGDAVRLFFPTIVSL